MGWHCGGAGGVCRAGSGPGVESGLGAEAALYVPKGRRAGWKRSPARASWPVRGRPLLPGAEHRGRAGPEVGTNGLVVARFTREAAE